MADEGSEAQLVEVKAQVLEKSGAKLAMKAELATLVERLQRARVDSGWIFSRYDAAAIRIPNAKAVARGASALDLEPHAAVISGDELFRGRRPWDNPNFQVCRPAAGDARGRHPRRRGERAPIRARTNTERLPPCAGKSHGRVPPLRALGLRARRRRRRRGAERRVQEFSASRRGADRRVQEFSAQRGTKRRVQESRTGETHPDISRVAAGIGETRPGI